MNSTTLMTFLLATDPDVRSVKLFGSWDNFSKPYIMQRDKRIGPGYWKKCYTFSNIICDGSSMNPSEPRSGGLKMGGTYWYYYLLDDDTEHYNEAEPTTSHCPFLPGQPVNILQVPILLPDSEPAHTHEGGIKTSHTFNTPDHRTMNPEDRFMHPRQPPKPRLPRLRTSLEQPTAPWPFRTSPLSYATNKATSQPTSAAGKPRGGSRASVGSKASRSISPPRSRDLREAFRRLNTSTPNLTGAKDAGDEDVVARPSAAYGPRPKAPGYRGGSPVDKEMESPFGRPFAGNHGPLSIQDRRAMKTKRKDPSPFRSPLTVDTRPDRFETSFSHQNDVPTLRALAQEIAVTGDFDTTPAAFGFQEKRLPTLPNTPSSVMDEALRDLDAREKALDAENIGSHFSDFSATDESSTSSPPCERSRFSEWSTDTEQMYPESVKESFMSKAPSHAERQPSPISEADDAQTPGFLQPSQSAAYSDPDPDTPHLTVNSQPSPAISMPSDSPGLPLPVPRLAVTGSPSLIDVSGVSIEDDLGHVETNPKRHAAFFGSLDRVKGPGLSPRPVPQRDLATPHASNGFGEQGGDRPENSAPMQEMLDELAQMKNMIQSRDIPRGMI